MPRRGKGSRSSSLQVRQCDSFQSLRPEPTSPTFSDSTARAKVNCAESENTLSGRPVTGAFPQDDVGGSSRTQGSARTQGSDTQHCQRNDIDSSSQRNYIRMDTPDDGLDNNEGNVDSDPWRRVLRSENDKVQLSDMFSTSPDSDSVHLGLSDFAEPFRKLSPCEVDSEQWRRVAGSEIDEAIHLRSLRGHSGNDRWEPHSETEAELRDDLHGHRRQPSSEVDSDQWGPVESPDTHVRISSRAMQSQWSPPPEPVSNPLKGVKRPEPRQHPSSSNPDPNRGAQPQHRQAAALPGSSSTQRRQTMGSGRPLEPPAAGHSSAGQKPSSVNEQRATGVPPGAPTGPRRWTTSSHHQSQKNVPTRSNDRNVTFEVFPGSRGPGVEPAQAVVTSNGTRRRAASRGDVFSRQIPFAMNAPPPQAPPSADRAARQTSANQNPVTTTTKVVQRTEPIANRDAQQQPPVSNLQNPQRDPTPDRRKRTRTRTRNKRGKNPVWATMFSKRRYVMTAAASLLSLVLLVVLRAIKA